VLGAEVWFLVVGAVLLMAATVIEAKNSYSHKLLLFSAYVFTVAALVLVFLDAIFLDATIFGSY